MGGTTTTPVAAWLPNGRGHSSRTTPGEERRPLHRSLCSGCGLSPVASPWEPLWSRISRLIAHRGALSLQVPVFCSAPIHARVRLHSPPLVHSLYSLLLLHIQWSHRKK